MDRRDKRMEELTHLREIFGELDQCVELAVQAEDTGQWEDAWKSKKQLDEKINKYLENGMMVFQSANAIWKLANCDWLGAIIAMFALSISVRRWWKRRRSKGDTEDNDKHTDM